jgi:multiple sugar transport system permease protein
MTAYLAGKVAPAGPLAGGGASRPPDRRRRTLPPLRALGYVGTTWIFMIAVGIVPAGYAVWMSLTDQSLTATTPSLVGLRNFSQAVFTPRFLEALVLTLTLVVCCLVVQLCAGYLLAVCLNRQLRGFRLARTVLLIPMLLTPAVVGLIWNFMFNPDLGIVGAIQRSVGQQVNWLADPMLARALVVIVDSWMHIPFVMLMVVAGLTSVPQEPIEAAAIDGAGWWQTTRYVVLPMLRPVLTITLLVRCVDIARIFDIIFTTTQGGPGTATESVSLLAYHSTFQFYQFGYGAAMSVALAVIMFPVYFLYVRLTKI